MLHHTGCTSRSCCSLTPQSVRDGDRISRCIVVGVAKFAHTSLFSGANNFTDMTNDEQVESVMGFTEEEIRNTFPKELLTLATNERTRLAEYQYPTDTDGALQLLAHWYK